MGSISVAVANYGMMSPPYVAGSLLPNADLLQNIGAASSAAGDSFYNQSLVSQMHTLTHQYYLQMSASSYATASTTNEQQGESANSPK